MDRFIGPIFAADVAAAAGQGESRFPVFPEGSAMFEAELLVTVGEGSGDDEAATVDSGDPAGRKWLLSRIAAVHAGIEVAASPVKTLPSLGSLATIAAFGNNSGLIIGSDVPPIMLEQAAEVTCSSFIDDVMQKRVTAADLPGGPLAALAFAFRQAKSLGFPIRPGQIIATGALTGMHPAKVGQVAVADFGVAGKLTCRVVELQPRFSTQAIDLVQRA